MQQVLHVEQDVFDRIQVGYSWTLLSLPVLNSSGSVDGSVVVNKSNLVGRLIWDTNGFKIATVIPRRAFSDALINGMTPLIVIAPRR